MAFRVDLETLILAVLEHRALHGYEIAKSIRERSGDVLSVGEGLLYPALHKLEKDELIASEWIAQEGKPAKKVYCLTDAGAKALVKKSQNWLEFAKGVAGVLRPSLPVEGRSNG